ncbi:MAG: tellurite resistance TerB family protein [Planctomycetota bacterium]|nr:tellurite resistance TerB family protein [Planctomycetota bacterium]
MGEALVPTLFRLVSRISSAILPGAVSNQDTEQAPQLDMEVLNCRVELTKQEDIFAVKICGSIHAPDDTHYTSLKISIMDVTDGVSEATPVHARIKQWQMPAHHTSGGPGSPVFCYNAEIGKLPQQTTILSDWTAVAQLRLDWLTFPRKGKRNLQFHTSILSRESGEELACAKCSFTYENTSPGYIDLQENISRTKALAVPVAFAVSAADRKMHRREIDLIKNWVKANINLSESSDDVMREIEKALDKTVVFFRDGNQVNIFKICKDLVEIAPLAQRYDILELCLYVAQADGLAAVEELAILKNLANWLEVDADKFRAMMEKILPVSMHEVKDTEVILGVTSDMDKEKSRRQLNKEYIKWNSRVTNSDPQIRAQADQMLMMIADARSQYVG